MSRCWLRQYQRRFGHLSLLGRGETTRLAWCRRWQGDGRTSSRSSRSLQDTGRTLQAGKGQVGSLAQIRFRQGPLAFAIGIPVPGSALFCFLASGKGPVVAVEGKGGHRLQPGEPGRIVARQTTPLSTLRIGEFVALVQCGPGESRGGAVFHRSTRVQGTCPALPNRGSQRVGPVALVYPLGNHTA